MVDPDPERLADGASRPRPRRLSSRVAYRNPWMVVREDRIERPVPGGGWRPGIYAVVEKPHAAAVVPWDGERLHLVGQFRYPLGRWSWEFPQGAVEGDDPVTPEQVARVELREETGFEAGRLKRLGDLAFAPGMADQTFTAWLATDLTPGPPRPEPEEEGMIVPRAVTIEQFDAMIDGGEIVDAATIATWFLARRRLVDG